MIDTDNYEGLTIDDWYKMNHHDWKDVVNEHNDLLAEVERLASRLRNAEDLLENYGYCRECYWDKETISHVVGDMEDEEITKRVWPDGYNKLCESCTEDFKEMIE
tara:strand:+ start:238 stop:552 length:315 start_codon:yes stop_codon:yes gene_type:complete